MPTIQSASPRLRAASSSGLMDGPSRKDSKPSRIASGERGDPEPKDRLSAPAESVEVGEDELPLSPRVAGVYDLRNTGVPKQSLHHRELLAGLVVDPHLELLRQDGQGLQPPLLVLLAVGVGRGELRQVPERPGDSPAAPHKGSVLPAVIAQGVRYVAPDRRLLGDDEPHEKEYTGGRRDYSGGSAAWRHEEVASRLLLYPIRLSSITGTPVSLELRTMSRADTSLNGTRFFNVRVSK